MDSMGRGDSMSANALFDGHLRLAYAMANVYSRQRPWLDRLTVRQAALIGLWDAELRFDPSLGVPFSAYARRRIWGTMADIRREDELLPRRARENGGVSVYVDFDYFEEDSHGTEVAIGNREALDIARAELHGLDEPARSLLVGHYEGGRKFQDIAAELGMSKSWASRVQSAAIKKIRKAARNALDR